MSANNVSFTVQQQEWINNVDNNIKASEAIKGACGRFNVGDVCLMQMNNSSFQKKATGEPVKFQVIHITPEGVAIFQRLNPEGRPEGELLLPPEATHLTYASRIYPPGWDFVQDPDQLDAIMLETEYDPMKAHKDKLRLKSDITKHNKRITVATQYDSDYLAFFKGLKVGDKFWTSIDAQHIVQKVAFKAKGRWFITTTDVNQRQVEHELSGFAYRRLYREQPRSYTREVKK